MDTDKESARDEKETGQSEAASKVPEELTEEQLEDVAGGIRGPDARNPKSPFVDSED